jgi:hypothetical protein
VSGKTLWNRVTRRKRAHITWTNESVLKCTYVSWIFHIRITAVHRYEYWGTQTVLVNLRWCRLFHLVSLWKRRASVVGNWSDSCVRCAVCIAGWRLFCKCTVSIIEPQ